MSQSYQLSLILSSTGFAELCSCNHNQSIFRELSNSINCCAEVVTISQGSTSCCSSSENNFSNSAQNKKCDDLHSSCSVCNVETFPPIYKKDAILVNYISSTSKVFLKGVQLVLANDNIDNSKKITFLKFLRINNLSNIVGKDILISIKKLKILLPALA